MPTTNSQIDEKLLRSNSKDKYKDIEDAIQKAIETESGKIENKNKNKTNTA